MAQGRLGFGFMRLPVIGGDQETDELVSAWSRR